MVRRALSALSQPYLVPGETESGINWLWDPADGTELPSLLTRQEIDLIRAAYNHYDDVSDDRFGLPAQLSARQDLSQFCNSSCSR